jgi:hypothetical protein
VGLLVRGVDVHKDEVIQPQNFFAVASFPA